MQIWLKDRRSYISVKGRNSFIRWSDIGTIQGSILGPFLYALFVSPLFDLTSFHAFADDSQVMESGLDKMVVISNLEKKIEMMLCILYLSGLLLCHNL